MADEAETRKSHVVIRTHLKLSLSVPHILSQSPSRITNHRGSPLALPPKCRPHQSQLMHFCAPSSARTHRNLRSSAFRGVSFKSTLRSFTLSRGTRRSLTAVAATKKAVAVLKGNSSVEGDVILTQKEGGPTTVNVRVTGLAPGPHGFHLYTSMVTQPMDAFQPHISTQTPEDEISHAVDLGNITANADGVAEATILDSQIPLIGPKSAVGRAFVVHELKDDLGKGVRELSLTTGNAGGRLACVVVGLTPV